MKSKLRGLGYCINDDYGDEDEINLEVKKIIKKIHKEITKKI
ncbi:MAG: hypothetical protein PF488_04725 [Patescibacteria group bacterium]|jgi:hypothetical protein|nr:hypothetical protein [Patescibacteria group bacterium]